MPSTSRISLGDRRSRKGKKIAAESPRSTDNSAVNQREEKLEMILKHGQRNNQVLLLQESLSKIGYYSGRLDGIFGDNTEECVEKFQTDKKILVDGIVGSGTVYEIDLSLSKLGEPESGILVCSSVNIVEPNKRMRWIKCSADIFEKRGGYKSLTLRSDAAEAYKNLYDDVKSLGGIVTTAGGKRSLSSKTSPSRSKKSMHYVGLAFDLSLATGMQNYKTDPYIVVKRPNRKWEIFCRTEDDSVPVVELEATVATTKAGKTKISQKKVKGRFFSFTALAEQHGFYPISARSSFFRGGSYTGAEWWHFQWNQGLDRGKSTFGSELLKVYPRDRCEKFLYWNQVKCCVFGIDWF